MITLLIRLRYHVLPTRCTDGPANPLAQLVNEAFTIRRRLFAAQIFALVALEAHLAYTLSL